jgi:hypothetical protein
VPRLVTIVISASWFVAETGDEVQRTQLALFPFHAVR